MRLTVRNQVSNGALGYSPLYFKRNRILSRIPSANPMKVKMTSTTTTKKSDSIMLENKSFQSI